MKVWRIVGGLYQAVGKYLRFLKNEMVIQNGNTNKKYMQIKIIFKLILPITITKYPGCVAQRKIWLITEEPFFISN
jgi:hypothetical protein